MKILQHWNADCCNNKMTLAITTPLTITELLTSGGGEVGSVADKGGRLYQRLCPYPKENISSSSVIGNSTLCIQDWGGGGGGGGVHI